MKIFTIILIILFPIFANAQTDNPGLFDGAKPIVGVIIPIDYDSDRVQDARLRNRIVRVERSGKYIPRLMIGGQTLYEISPRFGLGPFGAVSLGSDGAQNPIGGIATGIVFAFKTDNNSENDNSVNLKIGFMVDPHVKKLGHGIKENEPLPAGEDEINYQYDAELFWVFGLSFGW